MSFYDLLFSSLSSYFWDFFSSPLITFPQPACYLLSFSFIPIFYLTAPPSSFPSLSLCDGLFSGTALCVNFFSGIQQHLKLSHKLGCQTEKNRPVFSLFPLSFFPPLSCGSLAKTTDWPFLPAAAGAGLWLAWRGVVTARTRLNFTRGTKRSYWARRKAEGGGRVRPTQRETWCHGKDKDRRAMSWFPSLHRDAPTNFLFVPSRVRIQQKLQ